MKTVYSTSDYPDALIKKGMLEQAGFLVYVDNLHASGAMPELGFTVGLTIMVPESDVVEARKMLEETDNVVHIESVATDNIDTCPKCDGWKVVRHRSPLWLPIFWILDTLIPAAGGRHRKCLECGHKYKTDASDLSWPLKILMGIAVLYLIALTWIWLA